MVLSASRVTEASARASKDKDRFRRYRGRHVSVSSSLAFFEGIYRVSASLALTLIIPIAI